MDRDGMTHNDELCQIISVFDPDGDGGDFAYTVGLADRRRGPRPRLDAFRSKLDDQIRGVAS